MDIQKATQFITSLDLAPTNKWNIRHVFSSTKDSYILIPLLASVVLSVIFSAHPYLNIYDERFHALVAKNLTYDWLTPSLYRIPHLDYDMSAWWSNHIWLSKPILPLWLTSLSIKLFGVHVYSLRAISIIAHCVSVAITYRIGRRFFSKEVGILAALLYGTNHILLGVTGGHISSDLCEALFLVSSYGAIYYALSHKLNIRVILIMALFLVISFHCKYIATLLPAAIVIAIIIVRSSRLPYGHISLLLALFFLGIAPWLMFLWSRYPQETELLFSTWVDISTDHNSPHVQPWHFYFKSFGYVYGFSSLMMITVYYLRFITVRLSKSILTLGLWIFIPILLLSLSMVKRDTYLLICAPAVAIILSEIYYSIMRWEPWSSLKSLRFVIHLVALSIIIGPMMTTGSKLIGIQSVPVERLKSMEVASVTNATDFDPSTTIVFKEDYPIEFMFYHDLMAYHNDPSLAEYQAYRKRGFTLLYRDGIELKILLPENL